MLVLVALGAFIFTLLGGLLAIKLRDQLHLILGFTAGAVIGVAFFDLLPETMELGTQFFEINTLALYTALGFLFYMVLDRMILTHLHDEDAHDHDHGTPQRGALGAVSLTLHSLLDGLAVGIAFQASTAMGLVLAAAVLAHDFSDGINTVNFILKNKCDRATAFKWLMADALAPVAGIVLGSVIMFPANTLSVVLAIFTGFFLYIGASELVPESYHNHPKFLTTVMTLLGAGVMFTVIRLAG